MNDRKRLHILETAMRLFNRNGFDATPTSVIAKKAKISVGTLFNYFSSKTELIQAIYVAIKIHSGQTYLEELNQYQSDEDSLYHMWHAVIQWGIDFPEEFKYLEMFTSSPYMKQFKNENTLETYKKFRESILDKISLEHICVKHPNYLFIYMDHALHAATRYMINHPEIENKEEFIRESFDLLWYGLTQKKES
jgi:AcrR family transcriptional regulator